MKEVPPPNISCTFTFPLHEFSCAGVGMFLWGYIVCMISFFFFHLISLCSNIFNLNFPGQPLLHSFSYGPCLKEKTQLPHQIRPEMLSLLSTSSRSRQSWAVMARQPSHKGSLCLSFFFCPCPRERAWKSTHARKTRRGSEGEGAALSRRRKLTQVSNVCQAAPISTNWQKCV